MGQSSFPGALESQWIPLDKNLWKVKNYLDFLEARRTLLAEAANTFLNELLHGDESVELPEELPALVPALAGDSRPASVATDEEEGEIVACRAWVEERGLPEGELGYEVRDPSTGELVAMLDVAWPNGLQVGLSQPVALLIDEERETLDAANQAGFRYFTTVERLKQYVETEVLAGDLARAG